MPAKEIEKRLWWQSTRAAISAPSLPEMMAERCSVLAALAVEVVDTVEMGDEGCMAMEAGWVLGSPWLQGWREWDRCSCKGLIA